MRRPVGGDECSGSKFDRQDILVLLSIFAETGKSRLSVKPRPVGGELHYICIIKKPSVSLLCITEIALLLPLRMNVTSCYLGTDNVFMHYLRPRSLTYST